MSATDTPRYLSDDELRRFIRRLKINRAARWTVVLLWAVLIVTSLHRTEAIMWTGIAVSVVTLIVAEVWSGSCPLCGHFIRSSGASRNDHPDQHDAIALFGFLPRKCGHCGRTLRSKER